MRQNYKKDESSAKVTKKETLKRILRYCAGYRKKITFITIVAVISAVAKAIIPMFTEKAVDQDIASGDVKGLFLTIALALFFAVVWAITAIIRDKETVKVANEVVYQCRTDAYANILSLPLGFFDSRPSGRIISRVIGDADKMKEITKSLTSNLIPNFLMMLVIIVVMLSMNARLALAAFIVIPFLVVCTYLIIVKGYSNWENFRKKESNITAFVHEDYSGIRAIQSFSAEEETFEESDRLLKESEKAWVKAVRRGDTFGILIDVSIGLGYGSLLFFAFRDGNYTVGELLAFLSYIGLFWQPVRALATTYNQLVNNLSSAARLFEMMDEISDIQEAPDAFTLAATEGAVEFKNVTFSYPDDESTNILDNVSFATKGGSTIALVGPTGAGKTTIINLLARFYDAVEGEILIDGQNIKNASFQSLRDTVSVMPQDSMLFSGTIRDNLLYGKEVPEEEMKKRIQELHLEDLIASLPKGYDTEIKDAGLSSGQKQLIALARTLIASPKVLVLDEATSNVDTRTELQVQAGLKVLMEGRTSFIVAHRLSTVRNADEIFVVGNKTILERGSHEELMQLENGHYRALYEAQFALVGQKH